MNVTPRAHLVADRISVGYGERTVLHDFSVTAAPGSVTALLGANGAGKSTALRALARLMRPRAGAVTLGGRDVWSLPRRLVAQHLALVPQSEANAWPMTVEQLVLLGRVPHRGLLMPYRATDHAAVGKALRELGLAALRERDLDSLSGGERRRALLARALAQDTDVLLLDEPGAHLDLRHQLELFELLARMAKERQLAVVVSIHDLNLASLYADRAVLLKDGRTVAKGATQGILTSLLLSHTFGISVEAIAHPRHGVAMILPCRCGGGQR